MHLLYDNAPLTTREHTREGFLRGKAVVTRVGVQHYSRKALGIDGDPDEMVGVYRTPETVFHDETQASLRLMPVTLGHNVHGVNPQNARELTVGAVGDEVSKFEDNGLAISIALHGIEGINQVDDGHDQVSGGYMVRRLHAPGQLDGVPYEYITDGPMLYNHLALVETGRLGDGARVLDDNGGNNQEGVQVSDKNKKKGDGGTQAVTAAPPFDTEKFATTLGKTLADGLVKVLDARDVDAKRQTDADEDQKKQIREGARRRATILSGARALLDEEEFAKIADSEDREILVEVVKDTVSNPEGMSDDYLLGIMDMKVRDMPGKMKCDGCGKMYKADAKGKCPGCGKMMKSAKDTSDATGFYDRLNKKAANNGATGGGGEGGGRPKPTTDRSEVEKARDQMLKDMREGYTVVPHIGD